MAGAISQTCLFIAVEENNPRRRLIFRSKEWIILNISEPFYDRFK